MKPPRESGSTPLEPHSFCSQSIVAEPFTMSKIQNWLNYLFQKQISPQGNTTVGLIFRKLGKRWMINFEFQGANSDCSQHRVGGPKMAATPI